jgi:transposase
MRLGMDGLSRLAQDHLKQNMGNGCADVFSNKAHTRLAALLWDGTGVWLCQRRLHQGRFTWPDYTSTLFE